MVERLGAEPRPLPLTMFDGDYVKNELKEKGGLIVPKGSKVLLEFGVGRPDDIALEYFGIGPTRLEKDFEGIYDGKINELYHGMPLQSKRIFLAPDSEDRRRNSQKLKHIEDAIEILRPNLSQDRPEIYGQIRDLREQKTIFIQHEKKLNQHLLAEFLTERQEDLDFFNIDRKNVKKARIHVAVDREINPFS